MNFAKGYFGRHKFISMLFILCLCFSAGFFGAYFYNNTQTAKANTAKGNETVETDQPVVKVSAAAKFIYIRKYAKSQTVNIEEKDPPETLINADENAVAIAMSEWKLESFTADRITFSKEIDSYSPGTFKVSTIVKDKEELICVYEYDINGNESLKETFDTPVAVFDEAEAAKLREGIIVIGESALNKTLENYAE